MHLPGTYAASLLFRKKNPVEPVILLDQLFARVGVVLRMSRQRPPSPPRTRLLCSLTPLGREEQEPIRQPYL
jgi:hypothetical protein